MPIVAPFAPFAALDRPSPRTREQGVIRASTPRRTLEALLAASGTRFRRVSLLVLLGALSLGCSHFRKTKECRAVASDVNPLLERVGTLYEKGGADPATWTQIQGHYAALAARLKGASASDPELDRLRSEYVNVASSSAETAGQLASALTEDGSQPIYTARLRMKTLAAEQSRVTRRMAQYCRP